MQTLAINLDDDVYSRAEQKATALNTSVPEIVSDYLRSWSGDTGSEIVASASEEAAKAAARAALKARFAKQDWQFGVGVPDPREERNARR